MIAFAMAPYRFVELVSSLSGVFVTFDRFEDEILLKGVKGVSGKVRLDYADDYFGLEGFLGWTTWSLRLYRGGKYEYSVNPSSDEIALAITDLLSVRLPLVLNSLVPYFVLSRVDVVDFVDSRTAEEILRAFTNSVRLGLVVLSTPTEAFVGLFHRGRLEEGTVIKGGKARAQNVIYLPRAEPLLLGTFALSPYSTSLNKQIIP